MTAAHSPDWVQRYEDLRAHTVGSLAGLHSQAWGLIVFIQQGMRGWMRAWQEPPADRDCVTTPASILNPSLKSTPEITVLLTNMAVRCLGFSL